MFSFSMPELGVILVIALMVFGPGKLPEVGKSLGKGLSEFKRSVAGEEKNVTPKVPEEKTEVLLPEGKNSETKAEK